MISSLITTLYPIPCISQDGEVRQLDLIKALHLESSTHVLVRHCTRDLFSLCLFNVVVYTYWHTTTLH